ncbi:hypothetical protein E0W00_12415 [Salmonella enterica subsp. enterica serovar Llandoff]|nr:hypothetical protein [Salmonella enterica subsp. enterica serovar Llandoff]
MKIAYFRYLSGWLLLAGIALLLTLLLPADADFHCIAAVVACLSAVLLSAGMTAIVFLVVLTERPLIASMIKTGHYQRLVNNIFRAGAALFLLLVLLIASLFVEGAALFYLFRLSVWIAVPVFWWCLQSGGRFYNVIIVLIDGERSRLLREDFFSLTQRPRH